MSENVLPTIMPGASNTWRKLFAKIVTAMDESQRKKAAQIIRDYRDLIDDGDKRPSGDQIGPGL